MLILPKAYSRCSIIIIKFVIKKIKIILIMGYRINVNSINLIGHLIEGNIYTFYNEITSSTEKRDSSIDYFDYFFNEGRQDLISSNPHLLRKKIDSFNLRWPIIKNTLTNLNIKDNKFWLENEPFRDEILNFLKEFGNFLNSFTYKFLLLPGSDSTALNRALINSDNLKRWISNDSYRSYLVIQLKELPEKDSIQIFNSFIHYKKAIERYDEWPGLLIWQKFPFRKSRSIFVPVKHINEVNAIFHRLSYEYNFFESILNTYGNIYNKDVIHLIHISDLHLGLRNEQRKVSRLLQILKEHENSFNNEKVIIVTGDLVNTPSPENSKKLKNFENELRETGYQAQVKVPGNHDIIPFGILPIKRNRATFLFTSFANPIEIYKEYKLIFVKFNSNVAGNFAQGTIGKEQIEAVDRLLDKVSDLNSYCIIALLHHHPVELPMPTWSKKKWYESILGENFMTASLRLTDADRFLMWVKKRDIKFVIHGHKHIPLLTSTDNINIISGGSSTGFIEHIEHNKTFLTYNLIKYNIKKAKPITSTIIFEDELESGIRHYQVQDY